MWVGVFVNGRNVRQGDGLATRLNDGDEIRLLPPIAGSGKASATMTAPCMTRSIEPEKRDQQDID